LELLVLNFQGKLVQQKIIQLEAGSGLINLDMSGLAKGIYLIKAKFSGGETNSIQFIKQ
jgi:hypothetical protein